MNEGAVAEINAGITKAGTNLAELKLRVVDWDDAKGGSGNVKLIGFKKIKIPLKGGLDEKSDCNFH